MDQRIQIQLLGIGAIKILAPAKRIWVDAFNSLNEAPPVEEDDLILFTHNDSDHFCDEKVKGSIRRSNTIIGPPSIVYPFYLDQAIAPTQLRIYYPTSYSEPETYEENGLKIRIYNTEHFVNWHTVHISFMIETASRRLYITGDSNIRKENEAEIRGSDCIICSLINEDIVSGKIERKYGKYVHMWELIELRAKLKPKMIIGNHLLRCDWAVNPADIREIIEKENTEGIEIPTSSEEIVII